MVFQPEVAQEKMYVGKRREVDAVVHNHDLDLLRASELGKLGERRVTKQTILHYRQRGLIEADATDYGEFRFARWRICILKLIESLKRLGFRLEEIALSVWPLVHGRDQYEQLSEMQDESLLHWLQARKIRLPNRIGTSSRRLERMTEQPCHAGGAPDFQSTTEELLRQMPPCSALEREEARAALLLQLAYPHQHVAYRDVWTIDENNETRLHRHVIAHSDRFRGLYATVEEWRRQNPQLADQPVEIDFIEPCPSSPTPELSTGDCQPLAADGSA